MACYLAAIESGCVFHHGVHRRDHLRRHSHCRRLRDRQPDDTIARDQIRHHSSRGTRDVAARSGDGRPVLAVACPRGSSRLGRFGLLSAAGALAGDLIYTRLGPGTLTRVLGGLLLLTAVGQLTGWTSRWHPRGPVVALFGLGSGFFGGIAGNQGGLRFATMTMFGCHRLDSWPTATATGLLVDAARTPVYLWYSAPVLLTLWTPIMVATVGVLIGTIYRRRADATGTVASPFRPDHRRGNRRTRNLDAFDAGLTRPQ